MLSRQIRLCLLAITACFPRVAAASPEEGEPVAISAGMAYGGWEDRISFEVPPAPNGSGPAIALAANHGVTDGVVGSGWVLEATSVIDRRTVGGGGTGRRS